MSKRKFYSNPFWQRLRLAVLERDGWRCVPDHPGCKFKEPGSLLKAGKYMAHVHHKVDRADGGSDAPENLVACCRAYNLGEAQVRRAARARLQREREQSEVVVESVVRSHGRVLPGGGGPYHGTVANGASRDW